MHLAEEDREQIEKYKKFIKYTGKAKNCCVNVMNPLIVKSIADKFKISNRKTYVPVPLNKVKNETLLFSLIVGMLDGDGNIRERNGTTSAIEMKLHGSWLPQLEFIEKFIYKYLNIKRKKQTKLARLKKNGYSLILLTDRGLLAAVKRKVKELKLSVMHRKWQNIDENYVSREEKCEQIRKEIFSYFDLGMSTKEVIFKLNKPDDKKSYNSIHRMRLLWQSG